MERAVVKVLSQCECAASQEYSRMVGIVQALSCPQDRMLTFVQFVKLMLKPYFYFKYPQLIVIATADYATATMRFVTGPTVAFSNDVTFDFKKLPVLANDFASLVNQLTAHCHKGSFSVHVN